MVIMARPESLSRDRRPQSVLTGCRTAPVSGVVPSVASLTAMTKAPLLVNGVLIRRDRRGRYLLSDLHAAAGGESFDCPRAWATQEAISELVRVAVHKDAPVMPMGRAKLGPIHAVFVVEGLAYAYAAWVSCAYWLQVHDAFTAMHRQVVPS
jgi:hypothetical protein